MGWLFELHKTQPLAHAVGVLTFVCVLGMALGSVKFRGIGLGTAGVLFAGILVGHFGEAVDHHTLDFVKEFGLILFVFTIGLQLGPGFFAALRLERYPSPSPACRNRSSSALPAAPLSSRSSSAAWAASGARSGTCR
jgi:hypothetical protein